LYEDVPNNGRILRNLAMACNYLMSHILHFYHLVALDYVDVNGTGLIPKGFACPNYDSNYYARGIDPVLQTGGLPNLGINAPAYTVNNAPVANPNMIPGALGDLTPYLASQYVRALKARRQAHQLGALFAGKMPHASAFTPGCMTTKGYDPNPTGPDAGVVKKVHELLYGGPGFDPVAGAHTHPYNGATVSMSNPHPESLMGFIGKPSDFWAWAGDTTGPNTGVAGWIGGGLGIGFDPGFLPVWAQLGVPAATPGGSGPWVNAGWKYGGTFCFDTVAAAHCFPEYFWIGSGYGRYLAWGIFEGEDPPLANTPDHRLLTRGRVHVPQNPRGSGTPYGYAHHVADHLQAKEFTTHSWYDDTKGLNHGRHMWKGQTKANANKANAYTFAKTPRYYNNESAGFELADHPNDAYLPYEVGPLARLMSNATLIGGGPATAAQVVAVDQGQVSLYYPGVLADVDSVLGGVLGMGAIGVFPNWGANLTTHVATLGVQVGNVYGPAFPGPIGGAPVFYLPSLSSVPAAVISNTFHMDYMGGATLDRIAARTLETYYVGAQMLNWFNALNPAQVSNKTLNFSWGAGTYKNERTAPAAKAKGAGLTEAPRGALGHWIVIGKPKSSPKYDKYRGKVSNYQIITPTAWNINPKDAQYPPGLGEKTLGLMGPIERCIWQTPLVAESEPIEILRVIHSFDPCCACTVHVMNPKKEKVAETTLEALI